MRSYGQFSVIAIACLSIAGFMSCRDGSVSALVTLTPEPAGVNCSQGGQKIQSGLDDGIDAGTASNGILETGEIRQIQYVCNGSGGTNGNTALISTVSEPAGSKCPAGGTKVDSGLDNGDGGGIASNGMLEAGEVDKTAYVCNGEAGANGMGFNSVIKVSTESGGPNCPNGGQKIEAGLDNGDGGGIASNGILESGEVDSTSFVCNGANGSDGINSLVAVKPEPAGMHCVFGGQKIESGLDNGDGGGISRNNVLESGEVDSIVYICNSFGSTPGSDGGISDGGVSSDGSISDLSPPADGSSPSDMKPPPADLPSPPSDGSLPIDMKTPPSDLPAPPSDGSLPTDMKTPPADLPSPPSDLPSPPSDGSLPTDMKTPPADLPSPPSDLSSPTDSLPPPTDLSSPNDGAKMFG